MAKPTQKSLELAELIQRSDAARFQIGQAHLRLRKKLDVPLRIKDSLKSSPMKWLGGSIAAGFVGSLLFRPRHRDSREDAPKEKKSHGLFYGLIMMLFSLAKPTLKIYATKLVKDYVQAQLSRGAGGKYMNDDSAPY